LYAHSGAQKRVELEWVKGRGDLKTTTTLLTSLLMLPRAVPKRDAVSLVYKAQVTVQDESGQHSRAAKPSSCMSLRPCGLECIALGNIAVK
jgi:hypothetical protein